MVWAKLDDEILDNPKIAEAGPLGFALHVAAITWCCRNLTDGFIQRQRVRALLDFDGLSVKVGEGEFVRHDKDADAIDLAEHLVDVGLWKHDPDGRGYWLHDFLEYNPSRADVLAERQAKSAARAEAGKKGAAARWKRPPNTFGSAKQDGKPDGRGHGKPDGKPMASPSQNDGPAPVPVPVPEEPPSGGSSRAREAVPVSQLQPMSHPATAVTMSLTEPLADDARAAWETATMNTKPPDQPIEAVWVGFCGHFAGTEYPSRVRMIGRWQRWVSDECRMSEKRRVAERDRPTRGRGADLTKQPFDPNAPWLKAAGGDD
jgi:hypothetical protein